MQKAPLFVACEIGLNHMGDETYADQYLAELAAARPDGVEFQVREKAFYEKQKPGESPFLSDSYYQSAAQRMHKTGLKFGIALSDKDKVSFFEEIDTDFYKVLSKDINNTELVTAILKTGKPVYVSTGTSSEEKIESFLKSLGSTVPKNLSLIHTQLSYEDRDTNLRAIKRLQEKFSVPVAFGSHSTDVNALYTALAFDPTALFFYVKGNRPIKHRDEEHALSLLQCPAVVAEIRKLKTMMGDGIKKKMENTIPDQKHGK